jgi:hypothetical protein
MNNDYLRKWIDSKRIESKDFECCLELLDELDRKVFFSRMHDSMMVGISLIFVLVAIGSIAVLFSFKFNNIFYFKIFLGCVLGLIPVFYFLLFDGVLRCKNE